MIVLLILGLVGVLAMIIGVGVLWRRVRRIPDRSSLAPEIEALQQAVQEHQQAVAQWSLSRELDDISRRRRR